MKNVAQFSRFVTIHLRFVTIHNTLDRHTDDRQTTYYMTIAERCIAMVA